MWVAELWRYPVKTMGGEKLSRVRVGELGLEGDRLVRVEDGRGYVVTSRTHPRFLAHHATLGPDGQPLVDGRPWNAPDVADDVKKIAGPDAQLVWHEEFDRFDILPLLVATDGAIAAFGHDLRRLRPNIVVGGVEGMTEREWEGGRLYIGPAGKAGTVVVGVQDLRDRCVMTSYDPDTQVQDKDITRDIYRRFEGKLALNCFVIEGGEIAVGDEVQFVPGRTSKRVEHVS